MKAIRRFNVRTVLPEPIAALGDLALNLHWSWHPSTRDLFKSIDPVRWDECHQDPTKMLARLSAAELATLANDAEFVAQLRYLITELYRVIKPGRSVSFHCMNLPTTKMRQGFIGLRDFRGDLIRAFQDAGFIYHAEVAIWKDPVVAMQRTKALGLLHKTIRENASMSRMGLPDYVVTMRKPGDAEPRVTHGDDLPVALWQKYASPIWDDIDQGRTLNRMPARDENDEKHMCPLQLDVIERCIHLWTNPNDLIFSPFTGIGSEGYCALRMGRRFIGAELKPQYWELACQNIADAAVEQKGLFA